MIEDLKLFITEDLELWIADGLQVDRTYLTGKYIKKLTVIEDVKRFYNAKMYML